MVELRRHARVAVDVPVEVVVQASGERLAGRCTDLSLGGMYVHTPAPPPFGSRVLVRLAAPGQREVALPAVVRWTRAAQGMGVQFGLLGARETHVITELTRAPGGGGGRPVNS